MRLILLSWLFFVTFSTNFFGVPIILVTGQCQSDQHSLLLQLKNSLTFDSTLSEPLVRWNQSTDCCTWSGVDCDMVGRVIGLDLSKESISGQNIPSRLANLTNLTYLNLSTAGFEGQIPIEISSLTRLVTLDLSCYWGAGSLQLENPNLKVLVQNFSELRELYLDGVYISTHGNEWGQALSSSLPNLQVLSLVKCNLKGKLSENIFKVSTLETLDLSFNYFLHGSLPDFPQNNSLRTLVLCNTNFSGTLPHSIGNLKSLSKLDLASCQFTGPLPPSMGYLTQLEYVDLSFNHFTGPLPPSMGNLTRLEYVDLSVNNFSGFIPSFHMSRSLKYLILSDNVLTGGISSTNWEQLQDLSWVDLSNNSLNGSIPPSLFALPLLQHLWLRNNQFEGQIPEFLNASSSVLEYVLLSDNRLEGPIPMSIFELKNLLTLDLSSNMFNGMIPNLKNRLSPITELDLSDNQISGEIPNWIWEVVGIFLNLSHNSLVGFQEPYSILNLDVLDLHSNQLQGKIPLPPLLAVIVDYSSNNFTSSIPDDIGNIAHSLKLFSVSNNKLTGVIPESLCNASSLEVLDLSINNLSGRIPTCLTEMGENLGVLNARRNNLYGTIPDRFLGNCGLQMLSMNSNRLEGSVPKSLANCTKLEVLDLGNNNIRDAFPCWLKDVSSLHVLVLRSNKLYGNIDCLEYHVFWPMLQIIDLASNNFTGRLPQKGLTTWEAMMVDEHNKAQSQLEQLQFETGEIYYQDAVTVTMKGQEMELVKILTIFTSIDLSSNNFQGSIPEELGLFNVLHVLNLSHNAFTGSIPSSVGNLRQLESLDLSMNNLCRNIPTQLASLNFLSVLNLSYNHFVGRIPTSTQLQSFSPTSFEGNEGLCGPPLTKSCTNSNKSAIPSPSNQFDPSEPVSSNEFDWKFFLVIGVGFGTGFVAAVSPLIFSDKVNLWYDIVIHKFLSKFCM